MVDTHLRFWIRIGKESDFLVLRGMIMRRYHETRCLQKNSLKIGEFWSGKKEDFLLIKLKLKERKRNRKCERLRAHSHSLKKQQNKCLAVADPFI